MTPLHMYGLILLTKLPDFGIVVGTCGLVVCILAAIFGPMTGAFDVDTAIFKRAFKWGLITGLAGLLINFFGVDMKQLALIYGIPAVVNNEQAQKLPNNVLNVVNSWLEEQAKEGQK